MSVDLVTVAIFETAVEASPARAMLEAEGIQTYLQGEVTGYMLWYMWPGLGGVKLQVENKDVQQATELLRKYLDEAENEEDAKTSHVPNWVCPRCGAEVDAGFEICWSCGTVIDDVDDNSTSPTEDFRISFLEEQTTAHQTDHPVWFNLLGCFFSILLLGLIAQISFYFHTESQYYFLLLILPLVLFGLSIAYSVTTRRELKAWTPNETIPDETLESLESAQQKSQFDHGEHLNESDEIL
jgi:hypothetical protein